MRVESALLVNEQGYPSILPDYNAYKPYWQTIDPPNQSVTVPASSISPLYPMTFRVAGLFRGHYLLYTSTHSHLLVNIVDGRDGYRYMNSGIRCHIDTIATDDPGYPAIFPEALVLKQQSSISIDFHNLHSASSATVRFCAAGFMWDIGRVNHEMTRGKVEATLRRLYYMRPFFAPLDAGAASVADGATGRFFITLDDAGYFEVSKIAGVGYSNVGTGTLLTTDQARRITIRFLDTDRLQWSPGAMPDIPFTWLNTGARRPYVLPVRTILPPRSQIALEVYNASGVNAVIFITLIGKRVFSPAKG